MNNILKIIDQKKSFWNQCGPRNDIVLSTRIRLGRNSCDIPFPDTMTEEDLKVQSGMIGDFQNSAGSDSGVLVRIEDLDLHEKRLLREKNIVTSEMEASGKCLVFIDRDRDFCILINDEDHFRMQVIRPGFQLYEAYKTADAVDDELNKFVSYAFSENYGFLSSDPSKIGTGLKVSAILHLPVLTMQKHLNEHIGSIRDKGFQLSGTLGNGGRVIGGMYVVSSRKYLGLSEVDVLDTADDVISGLVKSEDEGRDEFLNTSRRELEDGVWKSLGILLYARRLSYIEAIEHLSRIRLGIIMSVIREPDINELNDLMVRIQWSHLQENYGRRFTTVIESDECRARFLREELKQAGEQDV